MVAVDYRIEIYDTWGRRIAAYDEVPLLEVTRSQPDNADRIRGLLPPGVTDLSPGYQVRVFTGGELFCQGPVTWLGPQWSDTRKLILDRYVYFREAIEFEAERAAGVGNTLVARAYINREISDIVKDVINSALGAVHYLVAHTGYPDGAQREYAKFSARKTTANELEVGGISAGQWVGSNRIDAGNAYAKDGDTLAGLVVDGAAWPDVRLLMIDAEETSPNSHAVKRHPEVAGWPDDRYNSSGYKLAGDAAKAALQDLMDTKGIDYIELNPHRNAAGEFDDRVDVYGRYIALVCGGGECFNAALVEQGHADVYLYQEGKYHVPEMALKDFYSYVGEHADSIAYAGEILANLDVRNGVFEVLTALAYAADGFVWSVDPDLAVAFRPADGPDRVLFFDPTVLGVTLGSAVDSLANILYLEGNPFVGPFTKTYYRQASIDEYGVSARNLSYFSMSLEEDADKLVAGILDDLGYPEPSGSVMFLHGDASVQVGDLVELRGGALRRLEREVCGEWGSRFPGKLPARAKSVTHRFTGKTVCTIVTLTSPLRSVSNPLSYMVRSQPGASALYQFRLDDATVGLDRGYHLD